MVTPSAAGSAALHRDGDAYAHPLLQSCMARDRREKSGYLYLPRTAASPRRRDSATASRCFVPAPPATPLQTLLPAALRHYLRLYGGGAVLRRCVTTLGEEPWNDWRA